MKDLNDGLLIRKRNQIAEKKVLTNTKYLTYLTGIHTLGKRYEKGLEVKVSSDPSLTKH